MKGGHSDAMPISHGHRPQTWPFLTGPDRKALCRQFDIGPFVHAQIHHVTTHPLWTELVDDAGRYGIGRMDQRFHDIQGRAHVVAVLDAEASRFDRGCIPPSAKVTDHASVDRRGDRQRLECRSEFVDLVCNAVEHQLFAPRVDLVGIEFGQRCECQHLAGIHIQNDAGPALRLYELHPATQFIFECALNTGIDRQGDGRAARSWIGQMFVEDLFHPHATVTVGGNIAEDVSRHRSLRVMAIGFRRHFERQLTDFLNPVRLFGQHATANVALLAGCKLRGDGLFVKIRENRFEFRSNDRRFAHQRRTALAQRFGIEPQSVSRKCTRQRNTVAIRNLAPGRKERFFKRCPPEAFVRHAEISDADQRQHRDEGKPQNHPQHPPTSECERLLANGDKLDPAGGHRHADCTMPAFSRGNGGAKAGKSVHWLTSATAAMPTAGLDRRSASPPAVTAASSRRSGR